MLVLTRRAKEKVSFPQVGITVHFIRVQSGQVKVGIDAPREIAIVRDEVDDGRAAAELVRRQLLRLPREVRHGIRNELHEVSVGMHLFKELMKAGLTEEADETFEGLKDALKRLDANEVLRRPDATKPVVPPSCSIVVIEDDVNERELLVGLLRLKGYSVVDFEDGQQALEYFSETEPPRLILVDMHMPRCDGSTTVHTVRETERFNDTLIFAISGTSPEENGLEIGKAGVDRWFPKPLSPEFLLQAIDRLIDQPAGTSTPSQMTDSHEHT